LAPKSHDLGDGAAFPNVIDCPRREAIKPAQLLASKKVAGAIRRIQNSDFRKFICLKQL
jgi:hypothetical protein